MDCRNVLTPVTWSSFGRNRAITLSAEAPRTDSGLSAIVTLALAPPPPEGPKPPLPTDPVTVLTAGSCWMIAATSCSFPFISWNELVASPRMPPCSWPVSCCGNNPLGMTQYKYTFSPIVANRTSIIVRGLCSAHSSVRR